MYSRPPFLLDLLHICEFIALFFGVLKFNSVKQSYWKWFVYYISYIFIYEIVTAFLSEVYKINVEKVSSLIQIPLEFIFLYWLFAFKSLKIKKLFYIFTLTYLFSMVLEFNLTNLKSFTFYSLSKTFGTLLLLILVVLEFMKQIKSDSILKFKEDKMFYINIGVILFYVGNMPFFGLYRNIIEFPEIWNSYYKYFMLSNCVMYLLFAASFIWGKVKS
ncbi:hypothetical protein [Flavobacterium sp.]|uniref:hypothetical protein n=1 Tax=Flavobacterium sp. TaxID=239 RepID=UPI00261AD80A|nr:hypothetical protein [Flavobacterium sp.]